MGTTSPGLRVEGLTFAYGPDRDVLSDARLAVLPGQVHCVLGGSGCGKTTLLRLIAGLEVAQAGTLSVDGKVLSSPTVHVPPEHRPVGMVFQDFALFPNRSVLKNVTFGMRGLDRSARRRRAHDLLRRVGMGEYADRMPDTLSGGQLQRVALARSLATEPSVMLLDEPFSSLDTDLRASVRAELLGVLRASDVATVMVTHDPAEAEAVADAITRLGSEAKGDALGGDRTHRED